MRSPDSASKTKLHAEINIYINQQYTLFVSAVTLVGAMMAWVSQRVVSTNPDTMDVAFLGFAALSVFLIMIAMLEARLEIAMVICGTYLRLSGSSEWERQIDRFREASGKKIGLSTRGTFYISLGVIVLAWPLFLALISFDEIMATPFFVTHIGASLAYFLAVFLLIPWGVRLRANEIENIWRRVLSSESGEDNKSRT